MKRKGKNLSERLRYLQMVNFYNGFSEVEFIDGYRFPRPMPFLKPDPIVFDLNKTGDYPNYTLNSTTIGDQFLSNQNFK